MIIIYLLACFIVNSIETKPAQFNPKRASSSPYISGDSFRAIAHHIFDETDQSLSPHEIQNKDIVFVKTDYLQEFFTSIHPFIQGRYILISHNSDYGAPGIFEHFLDDTKIIAWFGQNPTIMNHPKFIPIPIGIANQEWTHGNTTTFNKALSRKGQYVQKKYLLGINFAVGTKPDVRQHVYNLFSKKPFCSNISNADHFVYLLNMLHTQFILCPVGNGLDCHRTWEALIMGAIPVMVHSMLDELLADLPVIIVDQWSDITEDMLHKKYKEMNNNKDLYHADKSFFPYWLKVIEQHRNY